MSFTIHSLQEMVRDFTSRNERPKGKILTLSKYDIDFNGQALNAVYLQNNWENRIAENSVFLHDEIVFKSMGFEQLEAMDFSDYENAGIIHDLNNTDVSDELLGRYDCILDGGTLEHIYNLPNALECVFKMLKIGGTFYFDQPAFHGVNHGFYNISPCFYQTYFSANKYRINRMELIVRDGNNNYHAHDLIGQEVFTKTIHLPEGYNCYTVGSVTKTEESVCTAIPNQGSYEDRWEEITRVNEKIDNIIDQSTASGNVFFYGTGRHARMLIKRLSDARKQTLAITGRGGVLSTVPDEIGKYFMYNIKIYDISRVTQGDTIIIASRVNQEIIFNRIKRLSGEGVNVVKLY